jgi:L-iditol 2-dehydrogenase
MKACVLHGVGDLRYEDAAMPSPREDEVLIRVGACGVCGSDIPRVFEKGTYSFPTIPGHEFAGTVVAAGGEAGRAMVGKRVAVYPLIPCRECFACRRGEYQLCAKYGYLGSRSDGAFAEYVCAPVWNLVAIPPEVSMDEAAMTEPAAVALHALRQGEMKSGDTVAVVGAGPIGLLVALWARVEGAMKVLIFDVDAARLDTARKLGFEGLCNPNEADGAAFVAASTAIGCDVSIEAAGTSSALALALQCARPMGTVVALGNPAGDITLAQNDYWSILRKQLRIVGSWNSSFSEGPGDEWRTVLNAMASKRLDVRPLITHRVGLESLPTMMNSLRDKSVDAIKVLCQSETR